MTPCEKLGYKVGDRFEINGSSMWKDESIAELFEDNDTNTPLFKLVNGTCYADKCDGEKGAYTCLAYVRPLKPEWDGTGLPPVGAVVEMNHPGIEGWIEVEIIAYSSAPLAQGGKVAIVKTGSDVVYEMGIGVINIDHELQFRPLRTERDKAIDEMSDVLKSFTDDASMLKPHFVYPEEMKAYLGKLYDHGYRKPQHKEG